MKYGEKVKKYRKVHKLSQLHLELEAGLSNGVISRIENSVINPSKETLFKIAIALELNIHELTDLVCLDEICDPSTSISSFYT